MDPRTVFCPNSACSARGQTGHGNITRHSRKEQRWRCRVCGRTFTGSQGTPLYRLRTSAELVGIVVALLAHQVRRCALCRPMLLCVDGLISYVQAFQHAFRTPVNLGQRSRPHLAAWPDVNIAQVIKQVQGKRVVNIVRRIVQGSADQVAWLLHQSQAGGVLHLAYIERLNATFRQRLVWLARRSRALARQPETLHAAMYLLGTVYNLCTPANSVRDYRYHHSLRVATRSVLPHHRRHGVPHTPAMAAGITDHRWTMHGLLDYRIPPPRLAPPEWRGRPSKMRLSAVAT